MWVHGQLSAPDRQRISLAEPRAATVACSDCDFQGFRTLQYMVQLSRRDEEPAQLAGWPKGKTLVKTLRLWLVENNSTKFESSM